MVQIRNSSDDDDDDQMMMVMIMAMMMIIIMMMHFKTYYLKTIWNDNQNDKKALITVN